MNINLMRGPISLMCVLLSGIYMVALSGNSLAAPGAYEPPSQPNTQLKEATFTLDNVEITIRTPFLPPWVPSDHPFTVSEPGAGNQIATASSPRPYGVLSVVAVPFGTTPPSESDPNNPLPAAQAGRANAYQAKLREYKIAEGGHPQPGSEVLLFNQKVTSDASLLQLDLTTIDGSNKPFLYVEWVVEAGPRLWIVRVMKELPDGTTDLSGEAAFLKSLESLTLTSNNLDSPTTLKRTNPSGTPLAPVTPTVAGMPETGNASDWVYGLPTLLVVLFGGLAVLGGFYLRRMSGFNKKL